MLTGDVRAVAFDVNGTLVHIRTDEGLEEIFRAAAHLLTYQGIELHRHQLRELYERGLTAQQRASPEEFPEFDAVAIWRGIVDAHATPFTRSLPAAKREQLPLLLAELYRGVSRCRLQLYPHVREVLEVLRARFPLAVVSDAQSAYARAELYQVGLLEQFDPVVVSGDHGYRKPDPRLFRAATDRLGLPPESVLYVGNDMYRDIHGAQVAGMPTVLFDSDQGTKSYRGCVPDHTITDYRELLTLLGSAGGPAPR